MGGGAKQLLSTAIFVGASFLLPGSAAFTTSLFVKRFAVSFGLSLITKALAPKFKTPNELFAQQEQQDTTSTSTVQSWKIPYGETITGGQLIYSATSVYDNNWAHLLIVFSPVQIEGYKALFFNADKVASVGGSGSDFLQSTGYRQSEKWHDNLTGAGHAFNENPISVGDGESAMFYGWAAHGRCNGFPVGGNPTFSANHINSATAGTLWAGEGVRGIYHNTSGSAVDFGVLASRNAGTITGYGWSYVTIRNNYQLTDDYKDISFATLYDGSSDKGSSVSNVSGAGGTGGFSVNGNDANAYFHTFSDPVIARNLLGRDTATDGKDRANWFTFSVEMVNDFLATQQQTNAYNPLPINSEYTKGYIEQQPSGGSFVADIEHQTAIFKHLAFAHVTAKKDDIWQGGLPNISVLLKGVRVYDPRESSHSQTDSDTWEWSDNPALCLLNYLTDTEYGCSVAFSEIDIDSFETLANVCDQDITYSDKSSVQHNQNTPAFSTGTVFQTDTAGVFEWKKRETDEIYLPFAIGQRIFFENTSDGELNSTFLYASPFYVDSLLPNNTGFRTTQTGLTGVSANIEDISIRYTRKKYACNGLVDTDNSMKTNIDNFLSAMAAKLVYISGKYILIGGEYSAQEGLIDLDDIIGEVTVNQVASRRDRFNTVKTVFTSASEDYKPREALISQDAITIGRDGEETVVEVQLPMVTQPNQAKHLADITRLRGVYSMVVSMKCNMKVLQYATGDVVRFTYDRWGFTNKLFEISEMKINFGNPQSVDVTLVETGTNIYDHQSGA